MELSPENENHVKLSYILLNIVAKHLRTYFVKLWNEKYPDEKWQDDIVKRNLKLQSLLVKDAFTRKILSGNTEEWDTSTLLEVLSDSRLKLIEGSRPHRQSSNEMSASTGFEILKDIRNAFDGHVSSMIYSFDEFKEKITRIKTVTRNLFGEDAENEIEEIENSPITPSMSEHLKELLLDQLLEVELSPENENYKKLAYILLEIVARHLRAYFIKLWNDKYPDEKWQDDIDKRNLKFHGLLVKGMYTPRILNGNEQTWDTTTLTHAIVGAGLKLTEGSRPQKQRSSQLLSSEEIEVIRNVRNSFYGHVLSMSCSEDKFKDVMKSIKSAAKNLFGDDAEKEIEKFENSPVTAMMKKHAEKQLQDELKERYKIQYEKHKIHKVDGNRRIVMKEVKVDEFAVQLRIKDTEQLSDAFRGETSRHLELLEGMKGKYFEMSELINHNDRVTFISAIAGMGKSVLSKQLTYRWANGKIYTNYKFCIMMECRDINYFVLHEGADLKKHEIFSEFLKSKFEYDLGDAAGTLFIVDGLDELLDINENDSVIWQLLDIHNSKCTKAKIILTGRPQVEFNLFRDRKEVGGTQKIEILGLSEEQVNEYVTMFASCKEEILKINKVKDSSQAYLPVLYVPQFLNSLCCVAILSGAEAIRSAAELYCWTLYLLLKQHAEKGGSKEKLCSEIFGEYSSELLELSKICHELQNENKIIFEGNLPSRFLQGSDSKGKEFFEGLFTEVSDNRKRRFQFMHLTLKEFLSAVHICGMESRLEAIKNNISKGFYEVVLFSCQLMAGLEYDGIIQDMFIYDEELKGINVEHFLPNILELVSQSFETGHSYFRQKLNEQSFQLSIDIVMSFTNKDVANKQFIVSTIKHLRYEKVEFRGQSLKKANDVCKLLIKEYNCSQEELKGIFQNVSVELVIVDDAHFLTSLKYFVRVREIELESVESCVSFIQSKIGETTKCVKVIMKFCKLVDMIIDMSKANSELKLVRIDSCHLSKTSFINVCKWVATSSVEELALMSIGNIEDSWWEELADAIANPIERKSGNLALKKLKIDSCTQMISAKTKMKIMKCGVSVNGRKLPPMPAVLLSALKSPLLAARFPKQLGAASTASSSMDQLLKPSSPTVTPPVSLPPSTINESGSFHQQQKVDIPDDPKSNDVSTPLPPLVAPSTSASSNDVDVVCNEESTAASPPLLSIEDDHVDPHSTGVIPPLLPTDRYSDSALSPSANTISEKQDDVVNDKESNTVVDTPPPTVTLPVSLVPSTSNVSGSSQQPNDEGRTDPHSTSVSSALPSTLYEDIEDWLVVDFSSENKENAIFSIYQSRDDQGMPSTSVHEETAERLTANQCTLL